MEAGSCEKPMTTVSPPSDSFQSLALAVAYSVGEVLMPFQLVAPGIGLDALEQRQRDHVLGEFLLEGVVGLDPVVA